MVKPSRIDDALLQLEGRSTSYACSLETYGPPTGTQRLQPQINNKPSQTSRCMNQPPLIYSARLRQILLDIRSILRLRRQYKVTRESPLRLFLLALLEVDHAQSPVGGGKLLVAFQRAAVTSLPLLQVFLLPAAPKHLAQVVMSGRIRRPDIHRPPYRFLRPRRAS